MRLSDMNSNVQSSSQLLCAAEHSNSCAKTKDRTVTTKFHIPRILAAISKENSTMSLSSTRRFGLAASTALTLLSTSVAMAQTSNIIVDPIDETTREQATPTVMETLSGIADRLDATAGETDSIKRAYIDCKADAVRVAGGEASDTQNLGCGIDLAQARIRFFAQAKDVLMASSIDAAAQEQLIAKDILDAEAALDAVLGELEDVEETQSLLDQAFAARNAEFGPPRTQEEREIFNEMWRSLQRSELMQEHLEFMRFTSGEMIERLGEQREFLGALKYGLREAALNQDTFALEDELWIERAAKTGEVLALTSEVPARYDAIFAILERFGGMAAYDPDPIPTIEGYSAQPLDLPSVAGGTDGYAAYLERLDSQEGG